ncbi:conjugative transfer region protein TrbK [Stakelama pacifica]|uniref:Conjugative transfer region protein TrbK n=1 Tax=Stakelama pacifica TaxID=517720 RepID=A0A4R6FB25_9SPHN|nr:putative entry exclusion protein TrbK-alt [Stakelama pacifica]TDN78272.1 conjugative transfer region protein TrbK [Stakelama pacifica]
MGRRLPCLGWRSVAIAAAVAMTGMVALVAMRDQTPPPSRYAVGDGPDTTAPADVDPLRIELARCRTLPADTVDARCQAAWEVNRRRFMGDSRSYLPPADRQPAGSAVPRAPTGDSTPSHPLEH